MRPVDIKFSFACRISDKIFLLVARHNHVFSVSSVTNCNYMKFVFNNIFRVILDLLVFVYNMEPERMLQGIIRGLNF
jgi:hypothetical protein